MTVGKAYSMVERQCASITDPLSIDACSHLTDGGNKPLWWQYRSPCCFICTYQMQGQAFQTLICFLHQPWNRNINIYISQGKKWTLGEMKWLCQGHKTRKWLCQSAWVTWGFVTNSPQILVVYNNKGLFLTPANMSVERHGSLLLLSLGFGQTEHSLPGNCRFSRQMDKENMANCLLVTHVPSVHFVG